MKVIKWKGRRYAAVRVDHAITPAGLAAMFEARYRHRPSVTLILRGSVLMGPIREQTQGHPRPAVGRGA